MRIRLLTLLWSVLLLQASAQQPGSPSATMSALGTTRPVTRDNLLAERTTPPGAESGSRLRFVAPEKRWAVVIGVSRYEHLPKTAWLESGDKDATAFADFLQSPRGGGLPDDHLKLLLNEQATTRNVRLALDFLIKNVAPGDVATIFFAGHGQVQLLGSGEAAFLLPYDSDPSVLSATALPMDELQRYVDYHLAQASQVVLVTDACHSGSLVSDGPLGEGRRKRSVNDVLQDVGQREGVLNITACRRDEVAVEDAGLGGHGVLTYCLLKALNGGGDSSEAGIVRAQELLEYVTRQVPRLTEQEQHPRHGVDYTDEFPLANLNLEGPDYQVPDEPRDPLAAGDQPAFGTSRRKAELKVYGAAKDGEIYLLAGEEQRSIGRALTSGNVLVVDDLKPGNYALVQQHEGKTTSWEISLEPGSQAFDLRTGAFR